VRLRDAEVFGVTGVVERCCELPRSGVDEGGERAIKVAER